MRWTSIPRLYRRRLKVTLVPELLALIGIAVGVALLFASQVAGSTLGGSAARLADDVLGSVRLELVARSPEGLPQSKLSQVRALPGVRYATAVVEEPANAIGPRGSHSIELVGVEPSASTLGGTAVRRFNSAQLARIEALAVPESIASAIGAGDLQPITLQIAGQRERALVGLEVMPKQSALIASSPIVVAPLSYAQQLIGVPHRVNRIFIATQPGQESKVKRELARLAGPSLDARPAAFDATLFNQAAAPIEQSTTLFSAISALVGLAFAVYAMLLTVPHRRATVHDLRMLGYTRGQVVKILLLDALVLGVLASLLGLALGELISVLFLHANPGYLVFAFPVASQRQVSTGDILLAVGAAMLASFGGVFAPVRRIFGPFQHRAGPNEEEIAVRRNSAALAGLACLVLTTAVLVWAPQLALLGMASLTLAVLLMLPLCLDAVVSTCARLRKQIVAAAPRIAIVDLQYPSNRVRSLAIAATGAIAVFGSVAIGGASGSLQHGLNNSGRAFDSYGEIWVTPAGGFDILDTTAISRNASANAVRSLSVLPGVQSIGAYRGSYLDIGARRVWVLAPPADTAAPISDTQLVEGSLALATRRFREGGWVVVSQAIAAERHLRIGSRFELPTPVPSTLRVAAIGTNLGWPPGALILNATDYARAWGSPAASAYLIDVKPSATVAQVEARAAAALGPSGLTVQSTRQRVLHGHATSQAGLAQLQEISDMVLLAAVLAMAAAMTTLIWQRRPRLAQQQVEGFYRTTLWVALLIETSLLLGTGCLVGALFGVYGQLLLSHALAAVTGFPVVTSTGALVALLSFSAVTGAAVLVVALPGYAAARVRPSTLFAD